MTRATKLTFFANITERDWIEQEAVAIGVTRSEAIRRLIEAGHYARVAARPKPTAEEKKAARYEINKAAALKKALARDGDDKRARIAAQLQAEKTKEIIK